MSEHQSQLLHLAMRIIALWRERPAGVRTLEMEMREDIAGNHSVDVAAMNDAVERLDAIRDAGPFIAPVDRSLIAADVPIIREKQT
jgi:hypothetical protein